VLAYAPGIGMAFSRPGVFEYPLHSTAVEEYVWKFGWVKYW
jgi:hypothetical protein